MVYAILNINGGVALLAIRNGAKTLANCLSIDVTTTVSALENTTPKYSEPILDTPQTINEIPRQIMDQEGVTTLRDALRNTAGLSLAAGEGGAQGDSPDHPRLHRPQRSVPRWDAGLRQLLPRSL